MTFVNDDGSVTSNAAQRLLDCELRANAISEYQKWKEGKK